MAEPQREEQSTAHATSTTTSNGGSGGIIALLVIIVLLLVGGFVYFTSYRGEAADNSPEIELNLPAEGEGGGGETGGGL